MSGRFGTCVMAARPCSLAAFSDDGAMTAATRTRLVRDSTTRRNLGFLSAGRLGAGGRSEDGRDVASWVGPQLGGFEDTRDTSQT